MHGPVYFGLLHTGMTETKVENTEVQLRFMDTSSCFP